MSYGFNARLSGGSSNADHNLSIGGVLSSVKVLAQTFAWDGSGISQITINQAWGFSEDDNPSVTVTSAGVITITKAQETPAVLVTSLVDDDYTLNIGSAGVWFTFVNTATADDDYFTVTNPSTNMFSDITAAQSTNGVVDYRCIYYVNDGDSSADVELSLPFIDTPESYLIGFDGGGVDATAVTITDEYKEPTGVSWSAPTTSATLDVTLGVGEKIAVWIKRTMLPNNLYSKFPSKCEILADLSFV